MNALYSFQYGAPNAEKIYHTTFGLSSHCTVYTCIATGRRNFFCLSQNCISKCDVLHFKRDVVFRVRFSLPHIRTHTHAWGYMWMPVEPKMYRNSIWKSHFDDFFMNGGIVFALLYHSLSHPPPLHLSATSRSIPTFLSTSLDLFLLPYAVSLCVRRRARAFFFWYLSVALHLFSIYRIVAISTWSTFSRWIRPNKTHAPGQDTDTATAASSTAGRGRAGAASEPIQNRNMNQMKHWGWAKNGHAEQKPLQCHWYTVYVHSRRVCLSLSAAPRQRYGPTEFVYGINLVRSLFHDGNYRWISLALVRWA